MLSLQPRHNEKATCSLIGALAALALVGAPVWAAEDGGRTSTSERPHGVEPRFQDESGGVVLSVEAADLTLMRRGDDRPFFSYRAFATDRFRREMARLRDGSVEKNAVAVACEQKIQLIPMAWAGVILSVRETVETTCAREAHPNAESRFLTFAIVAPSGGHFSRATTVALTDWIGARAVFESLRRDRLIREAIASTKERPSALPSLLAALAESPPVIEEGHCYSFPDDLLSRFAPSHLGAGKLAVRLALPGAAVCRDHLTELGILLPLPPALAGPLSAAASGRHGFLMRNVPPSLSKEPLVIELSN